jgi:hypothetical protein
MTNPQMTHSAQPKSRRNPRGYALGLAVLLLCVGSVLLLGRSYGLLINLFVLFFALPMLLTHVYQLLRQHDTSHWHVLAASGLSVMGVILAGLVWFMTTLSSAAA